MKNKPVSLLISETKEKIKQAQIKLISLDLNSYQRVDTQTVLLLLEGRLARLQGKEKKSKVPTSKTGELVSLF